MDLSSAAIEGAIDYDEALKKVVERLPIVSFRLAGKSPQQVSDLLDREAGIAVRAGLHCAAQAHTTLGTLAEGTIRASFGIFNTLDEVDQLCEALQKISSS